MIKGKTTSGIAFAINENVKNDTRVLFYLTKMQSKTATEFEQSEALFSLLNVLMGSEENLVIFMNEVAAKNNGCCDTKTMMAEVSEIFKSLELKN